MFFKKICTWTGGMTEAVEHLLCKRKALNSNPSPTKNKTTTTTTKMSTTMSSQASVAHVCNPSYSGRRVQEDCSSNPVQANSSQDPTSKKPITKG
jgi:hypothetical protein